MRSPASRSASSLARAAVGLSLFAALGACDGQKTGKPPASISAPRTPARPTEVIRRDGNHLVGQPSPYLEQHAHNPVDWYPWSEEALARAKRENKPIFLSIGYATCHWCHVMEKESFEDDETARYLNEHFISIKVDREQRPDLDDLFIEAVSRLGGSAGWPLTVVLTPDLEPVFGGTYFPRVRARGMPALLDVLREVHASWREQGPALARRGRDLLARIDRDARTSGEAGEVSAPLLQGAFARIERARDATEGGFGTSRKFPNTPLLLAELRFFERTRDAAARAHIELTLEHAMRGGIRDPLAGTFHRYATDRAWHVPHFEKTLYDNAQLAGLYLEAARALGREDFEQVGRAVLDDLVAAWQRPDGGLWVGFDADDPRGEGVYYTFTPAELTEALGPEDARVVAALFGVTEAGEPSLDGRSVLHRREDAAVATSLGLRPPQVVEVAARSIPLLRRTRDARPAPAADDKELAGWNGLALMALADAGRWLDEPRYIAAAQRVAGFLTERCLLPSAGPNQGRRMLRGLRKGAALGDGFLEDYALPALGLIRLHAADGDLRWLDLARVIADAMIERFHDPAHDTFLKAPADPSAASASGALPLRRPDNDDGVVPSGSSAATLLMLELGAISGDSAIYERGDRALRAATARLRSDPFASGFLLVAAEHALAPVREVVIAGAPDDPRTRGLVREVARTTHARVLPVRLGPAGASPALLRVFPALSGKSALSGKPTAFVCRRGACELPTSDPTALRQKLAAAAAAAP
jgi:uncharacterized protein